MPLTPWVLRNKYPHARRSDTVNVYNSETRGEVRVHDPYQWLEEDSEETEQWTTAQAAHTRSYLDENPDRQRLEDEIRANTDYAKFSAPGLKKDGYWYWTFNSGLQAHSVLYRSNKPDPDFYKEEDAEVFFDSNLLSEDGSASLTSAAFSDDGRYWAYGISNSGSDYFTIYIRPTSAPLASKDGNRPSHHDARLPDELKFVKFSGIEWTMDNKGFFYQRYPERKSVVNGTNGGIDKQGDFDAMIYYHRVGTSQSEDILVMKDEKNPEWMWSVDVDEVDGKYLTLYTVKDTSRKNLLWITDLSKNEIGPNMVWDKIVDEYEAEYDIIAIDKGILYLKTNKDAPKYHVITIDLADSKRERKVLIPEDPEAVLEDIHAVHDRNFAIVYTRNVTGEVYVSDFSYSYKERIFPNFVGAAGVSGKRSQAWFYFMLTGFDNPCTIAHYDFAVQDPSKRAIVRRTTEVKGLVPTDFESRQVWYSSKDGTKVPMFIVRHKDTQFDGTAPALQYGYGGFSISINPFFSPSMLTFLQRYKAILAVPSIRGGAEFGEEWHLGGVREKKVNCFDDFIAASEYLVENKYAARGKIAINGGSNGGLLVGACVNRAPDGLFGAAVAEVGVLDLLKFADFTIGKAWCSDYGDPHDPHDFDFIYPISPLHNIPTDKVLPPMILLTADHDDRVIPMHSFKHAATLQHLLPNNPHPLLLRVDKKAGHGAGKATEQRIKESADKWGFVAQSLGLVQTSESES